MDIDPTKVGVIAVDVWNFHWCKTATMRVDAMVPRINEALKIARSMGMTIMLCPSDVVENYAGSPQRERVFALPKVEVPTKMNVTCPPVPDAGGCACGTEKCAVNYGWDGMHPGLEIGINDFMPDTQSEVYAICEKRNLTHLIYVGFHTQVCLLGKPMGLRAMKTAGLECVLARDMTDAHPGYDPSKNFTPDLNTEQVVEHFEKHLAATIHLEEEFRKIDRWPLTWNLEPVRVTPWGTSQRPHLFEKTVIVTLSSPTLPGANIHYTIDGSNPSPTSPRYTKPIEVSSSTHIRTAAFRDNKKVSAESEGSFEKLSDRPPIPQVLLTDLTPIRNVGFGHTYGGQVRYSANSNPPQKDLSNRGNPLRVDRKTQDRGLGVHAPCALTYSLSPNYKSFVALAGVDENIVTINHGSNLAKYPSVSFKVFIDHKLVASSPVMRMQSPAWRFNVPIPPDSKSISLVATDAGDGNREDLANWAQAGFTLNP